MLVSSRLCFSTDLANWQPCTRQLTFLPRPLNVRCNELIWNSNRSIQQSLTVHNENSVPHSDANRTQHWKIVRLECSEGTFLCRKRYWFFKRRCGSAFLFLACSESYPVGKTTAWKYSIYKPLRCFPQLETVFFYHKLKRNHHFKMSLLFDSFGQLTASTRQLTFLKGCSTKTLECEVGVIRFSLKWFSR